MIRLRGLQARFLAAQLAVVLVAVGAMALVAHLSISQQVQEYSDRNRAVLAELTRRLESDSRTVGPGAPPLSVNPPPPPPLIANDGADVLAASVNRSLLVAGTFGVLMSLALTLVTSRRIVQPLRRLTAAANRLERGDPHEPVAIDSSDEVGQLAHAFNSMAESLVRTERLRRQMVSDVAHELRTPLANLCGYLEAMQDGVVPVDAAGIDSLHDEAIALAHVVDDLRDLALADAGQLRLEYAPADVARLLLGSVNAVRPAAIRRGLALELEPLPRSLQVRGDPKRLRQVLRNLLLNAVGNTPPAGCIRVSAGVAGGQCVSISVQDTGIGIPAEDLPFVFERFYRVDAARARSAGGTGLGLAIVKQLVEAHDGSVVIESEPGRGTTVTLTLPAAAAPLADSSPDRSQSDAARTTPPVRRATRG